MKRFFFIFLSLLFLSFPQQVLADEGWTIDNFQSDISLQQSGDVRIVETIEVDFGHLSKHGIYRDIPYVYEADGKQTYTEIVVANVLQDNHQAKYKVTLQDGYVRLKIGDPDKTITNKHSYTITYSAKGILRSFSDHDELYWNVTGNNWPVRISHAEAIVTLPKDGITKVACYEGYVGSQVSCFAKMQSLQVGQFNSTDILNEAKGMTIVLGYTKGLFPIVTVEHPKTAWEQFISWPSLATLFGLFLLGVGTIFVIWHKQGRDFWFAGNLFGTKADKGTLKPLGGHETISVEFMSPEKLRPAEIGVLMDERADTLDVVATLIDLATRGYLTITEVEKKWLFGKVDYLLTKTTPKLRENAPELLAYEQLLLDKLFDNRTTVTVSGLKTTFYDDLTQVKKALYAEVIAKGLFPTDPEKVRGKYLGVAIGMLIGGIILTIFSVSDYGPLIVLTDVGLAIAGSGLVLLFMSRFMPRRTAYGRSLYRRSKGYYLFIDKAEKYRQQYFEKNNMFNEVLPYAIVFGLTSKFAKQMKEMGLEPKQTDWYSSSHAFSSAIFVSSISDFSQSMSTAIASTPSSSGGFSGGSSGGGFGGGGGGSW